MANATTKVLTGDELVRVEESVTSMEQIARDYGLAASRNEPPIRRAIRLSQGIAQLKQMLTVQQTEWLFMPLMGSPLGFVTDLDKEPPDKRYPAHVVRDVIVEALLRGYMPVGNEFNIIAGRFYAAKNGLERLVREYPGVQRLILVPGVPTAAPNNTALVPYTATWIYQGAEMAIRCEVSKDGEDTRIPVRVNSGMGPDAILGKAERKMYWRILKRLTGDGAAILGEEDEPAAPILTEGAPAPTGRENDGRRMRMGKKEQSEEQPRTREPGED